MFEKSYEKIGRDENGDRDAEIGRDIVSVGDDIRIEGIEEYREKSCDGAGALFRKAVEEIGCEESDENDRETREENDEIGVIAEAVHEEGTDIPLFIDTFSPQRTGNRKCRIQYEE